MDFPSLGRSAKFRLLVQLPTTSDDQRHDANHPHQASLTVEKPHFRVRADDKQLDKPPVKVAQSVLDTSKYKKANTNGVWVGLYLIWRNKDSRMIFIVCGCGRTSTVEFHCSLGFLDDLHCLWLCENIDSRVSRLSDLRYDHRDHMPTDSVDLSPFPPRIKQQQHLLYIQAVWAAQTSYRE